MLPLAIMRTCLLFMGYICNAEEIYLSTGRTLLVPNYHAHLPLIRVFKENYESSAGLLAEVILPGDRVFDVNPGYGSFFFPMTKAVGTNGIVFVVTSSVDDYFSLSNNTKESEALLSAKLLHAELHGSFNKNIEDFLDSPNGLSLTEIWEAFGADKSTSLIKISKHDSIDNYAYFVLHGAIPLIRSCIPFLYIENDDTRRSSLIIQLLLSLNYGVFWHISWLVDPDLYKIARENSTVDIPINVASIFLFASPPGTIVPRDFIQRHRLIAFSPGKYFLKQYEQARYFFEPGNMQCDLTAILPLKHSTVDISSSTAIEGNLLVDDYDASADVYAVSALMNNQICFNLSVSAQPEVMAITVHATELAYPWSLLIDCFPMFENWLRLTGKNTSEYKKHLTLNTIYASSIPHENIHTIISVDCWYWVTTRVNNEDYKYWTGLDIQPSGFNETVTSELKHLLVSCVQFLKARYRHLSDLVSLREQASRIVLQSVAQNTKEEIIDTSRATPNSSIPPTYMQYRHYAISNYVKAGDGQRTIWKVDNPFEVNFDDETCSDPVWCKNAVEMQRRIYAWQFPNRNNGILTNDRVEFFSDRTCENSKFLVFEPPSNLQGIGSMANLIAAAFRYAICLDRILVLLPISQEGTITKWRHPGCSGTTFECYFQPIHGCNVELSPQDIGSGTEGNGMFFDAYPLKDRRVLILRRNQLTMGPCGSCYDSWPEKSRFFDGLPALGRINAKFQYDVFDQWSQVLSPVKVLWQSHFLRFLLRPRPWFEQALRQWVDLSMYSPVSPGGEDRDASVGGSRLAAPEQFPTQYASLHVRFGMKAWEVELQPLSKYINMMRKKLPHLVDVFVSTESSYVFDELIRIYPEIRFHFLRYYRNQSIDFSDVTGSSGTDFAYEFMFSFANLFVSSAASGFVGTLTSNWCMLIHHMERTRGDGGYDYLSVDGGSAFSTCY